MLGQFHNLCDLWVHFRGGTPMLDLQFLLFLHGLLFLLHQGGQVKATQTPSLAQGSDAVLRRPLSILLHWEQNGSRHSKWVRSKDLSLPTLHSPTPAPNCFGELGQTSLLRAPPPGQNGKDCGRGSMGHSVKVFTGAKEEESPELSTEEFHLSRADSCASKFTGTQSRSFFQGETEHLVVQKARADPPEPPIPVDVPWWPHMRRSQPCGNSLFKETRRLLSLLGLSPEESAANARLQESAPAVLSRLSIIPLQCESLELARLSLTITVPFLALCLANKPLTRLEL